MKIDDVAPTPRRTPDALRQRLKTTQVENVYSAPNHHTGPAATVRNPARTAPEKPRSTSMGGYLVVVTAAVILGVLAQVQIVGQLLIALYAVASIIWHVASRTTFTLALLALGATVAALVFGRDLAAANFASYSFLFFATGALNLVIEQWRLSKALHKKHQRTP